MALSRSALDTEYLSWPVTAPDGITVNSDTAQVAFTKSRDEQPVTWNTADIVVDTTRYGDSTPRLRILVGPANDGITLAKGTWHIWGKIEDSPEVPVWYLDYIVIR